MNPANPADLPWALVATRRFAMGSAGNFNIYRRGDIIQRSATYDALTRKYALPLANGQVEVKLASEVEGTLI